MNFLRELEEFSLTKILRVNKDSLPNTRFPRPRMDTWLEEWSTWYQSISKKTSLDKRRMQTWAAALVTVDTRWKSRLTRLAVPRNADSRKHWWEWISRNIHILPTQWQWDTTILKAIWQGLEPLMTPALCQKAIPTSGADPGENSPQGFGWGRSTAAASTETKRWEWHTRPSPGDHAMVQTHSGCHQVVLVGGDP